MTAAETASTEAIICPCFNITESTVVDAVAAFNITNVKDLCRLTNAGGGCTACRIRLRRYLQPAVDAGTPGCGMACG